jgi:flagellar basal body-associated protein FliL
MVYVGLMANTGPSERALDLPGVCPVSTIIILIIIIVVVVVVSMFVFGFSIRVRVFMSFWGSISHVFGNSMDMKGVSKTPASKQCFAIC